MGFTPSQIGRMSLYQYAACIEGFNAAHASDQSVDTPTAEEFQTAKEVHGDA